MLFFLSRVFLYAKALGSNRPLVCLKSKRVSKSGPAQSCCLRGQPSRHYAKFKAEKCLQGHMTYKQCLHRRIKINNQTYGALLRLHPLLCSPLLCSQRGCNHFCNVHEAIRVSILVIILHVTQKHHLEIRHSIQKIAFEHPTVTYPCINLHQSSVHHHGAQCINNR